MKYPSEQSMLYVAFGMALSFSGWAEQGETANQFQSPHTLPHIRLIHPDWVKMGVDAAGQQPVLCVCVRVCEMCKCQPSLEIDLSAEKRFFQPYSFSSCISLTAVTGHFISVFPTWWDSTIWPLKIWTEAVFTHTHTVIQRPGGVWVEGLGVCVCPRGVMFLYSFFLFISRFLTFHFLLPLSS